MTPDPTSRYRIAIEEELQRRLAHDAAAPSGPLAGVRLMCLSCRAIGGADAQFCTRCGARFNALVVADHGMHRGDRS